MLLSWITLHPGWYVRERKLLEYHYPVLRIDEHALSNGIFRLYGSLAIRPPGGVKHHPIRLLYPNAFPYEYPIVTPLSSEPEWTKDGRLEKEPDPKWFDHRHQMPGGNLCLFQRETRATPGGDIIDGITTLRRAEKWFYGHHTNKWPPDSDMSELESHFSLETNALIADPFYNSDVELLLLTTTYLC